ncbi:FHA domain-containing protein [Haloimpatiens sp. FM7315]|uniref:FHA domain-containing protein n=1 Tax=Haloimpatiens sp. FM7315 TaxID=3298609 RepID=UPI00370A84C0
MDLNKFSFISKIFTIVIIAIIYVVIFFILKIMYKDVKNTGKKSLRRKKYGLEILEIRGSETLEIGSVIPVTGVITIGRKNDNLVQLVDAYVSGYHAKVFLKNNDCIIEDLESTNGTFVNDKKINGASYLRSGDIVQVGNSTFKVIG